MYVVHGTILIINIIFHAVMNSRGIDDYFTVKELQITCSYRNQRND